ncbi:hypothetical protein ACJRO7_011233 [Eucalyptus globulus]|uniref:Uncharacterized protein n=1 Tax=Eucalyptus globulus TaxID=34317 RepID=A0ABD3LFE7_EUCGL
MVCIFLASSSTSDSATTSSRDSSGSSTTSSDQTWLKDADIFYLDLENSRHGEQPLAGLGCWLLGLGRVAKVPNFLFALMEFRY